MDSKIRYAKYSEGKGIDGPVVLKDGHTMFPQDIVKDLNRKSYIEEQLVEQRATIKELTADKERLVDDIRHIISKSEFTNKRSILYGLRDIINEAIEARSE